MNSMRELAKRALDFAPKPLYRAARFASRLPVYFAADMAYQRSVEKHLGHGNLAITDDISIFLPSNRVANSVFRSMLFEASGRHEWREFLTLAAPCRTFADIGASGGFFSMLFAASRPVSQQAVILSIEPDPACRPVLDEMRELHARPGLNWIVEPCALAGEPETMSFSSSGFGGELVSASVDNSATTEAIASVNGLPSQMTTVEVTTLDRVCERHHLIPDLIKLDIESYEHEVLHASIDYLRRTRPRMHLELHCTYLRNRSIDPTATLQLLREAGYHPSNGDAPTWDALFAQAPTAFVLRTDLLPGAV